MKLLPMFLLNLALVAVALIAYDRLRSDPAPAPVADAGGTADPEVARRLEALEASREPALRAAGTDPRVIDRLAALELAVREHAAAATPPPAASAPDAAENPAAKPLAASAEPSDEEVRRFRKLREAARRQDQLDKSRKQIDAALDKLGINLSAKQRAKVHLAHAAFQPRINEIWGEAKRAAGETAAAGGHIDRATIIKETQALIQQSFVQTLTPIVSQADAESVAAALMPAKR